MIWTLGDLVTFDVVLFIGIILAIYYILRMVEKDIKIQNENKKNN